jgi:stage III sporulation protein AC
MSVDIIFKIAAVGILTAILNQVLTKSGREEMATMTTLAGLVVVLFMVIGMISDLFQNIRSVFQFQ